MSLRPQPVQLGVIGSSGGSALAAATHCIRAAGESQDWVVLTDRECGLLEWSKTEAVRHRQIQFTESAGFSSSALQYFRESGVRDVILFYTRRVASPLIDAIDVCNIHPSLLPAYPGMGAVKRAYRDRTGSLGATLHKVDAGLDTGPILAQVSSPMPRGLGLAGAENLSFLQKTWLLLVWRQRVAGATRGSGRREVSPALRSAFLAFQRDCATRFDPPEDCE